MAKRKGPPPPSYPISIEHKGKTYEGSYVLDRGTITVSLRGGGSKSTWYNTRSAAIEQFAQIILAELVAKK